MGKLLTLRKRNRSFIKLNPFRGKKFGGLPLENVRLIHHYVSILHWLRVRPLYLQHLCALPINICSDFRSSEFDDMSS